MSGRRRRVRSGFTLPEVLVAMGVAALVLALVIGLVRFAIVTVARSEERLDVREAATRALWSLRDSLTSCGSYAVEADGARIRFLTIRGEGDAHFDPAAGALVLRPPGQTRVQRLIPSSVLHFHAEEVRPGFLRISLTLARPGAGGGLAALAPLAVVEELLIPAAGLADEAIPWNPGT